MSTFQINQLNCGSFKSLFIPAIPADVAQEETIKLIIENFLDMGTIKRVDIVKKQSPSIGYMAFVHFEHWKKTLLTNYLFEEITEKGFWDHTVQLQWAHCLPNNPRTSLTMRFMENKKPIPETELNVHQLAANQDVLTNTIKEQEEMIMQLREELAMEAERNNRLEARLNKIEKAIFSSVKDNGYNFPQEIMEWADEVFQPISLEDLM